MLLLLLSKRRNSNTVTKLHNMQSLFDIKMKCILYDRSYIVGERKSDEVLHVKMQSLT